MVIHFYLFIYFWCKVSWEVAQPGLKFLILLPQLSQVLGSEVRVPRYQTLPFLFCYIYIGDIVT